MNLITMFQLDSFQMLQDPKQLNRIRDDFFIVNDLKCMPTYAIPTKMEWTVVSICLNGYTRTEINKQEYFIGPGTVMIVMPDQMVNSIEISDDYEGILIAMSRNYTDEIFPKFKVMLPFFFYTKEFPCINIKGEELNCVLEYCNILWEKVKRESFDQSKEIIQGLLMVLFYEIYAIYRRRMPRKTENKNRKEILFDQFMKALSESFMKERSVNFYARELCLTPKHLSSVVKEISGKTAGEWIDNFVIFEAKSLLKSSQKNIQEISDTLNFTNQSFFGKYFKHYTGVSPKEYRRM